MTPRSRRLAALSATAAITAAVALGSPGSLPTGPAGAGPVTGSTSPSSQDVRTHALGPAQDAVGPASATGTSAPSDPRPIDSARTARVSDRTDPVIDRERRGRDALRALGSKVAEAAARSGLSRGDLVQTLTEDDSAWVSREGRLYYEEPLAGTVSGPLSGAVTSTDVDPSATFALHSRPGARRSIVIDVDGAEVTGSAWSRRATNPLPDGTWAGWNSEGTATTYTATEHAWIQEVWRQVAESYAAFDVDVTTDSSDPSVWRRDSLADVTYGTRVVVTTSTTPGEKLCASACVGVAWSGVFDQVDPSASYQPAWVFATPLDGKPMSPLVAAQTVAHEAGHTFGLTHDGITENGVKRSYYEGSSTWGPLMGAAMVRGISHWSQGEYAGATNTQDDLAVIGQKLARVPDEDGGTTGSAKALPAAPTYDVDGVVSTRADEDHYRLDLSCATTLTAQATGVGAQAALDLELDLLDATGTVLATNAPTTRLLAWPSTMSGMDAQVSHAVGPGTYYLRVDGVGTGSASQAGAGWSDYGSLGRYRLRSNGCATPTSPSGSPSVSPDPTTPTTTPTPGSTPTTTAPAPTTPAPTGPAPTSPAPTAPVTLTRPGAPTIGTASSGASGGTISATARWAAPQVTGGQAILGYRVKGYKLDSRNRVVRTYTSSRLGPTVRSLVWRLPSGRYSFLVQAENALGASAWSARSRTVTAR